MKRIAVIFLLLATWAYGEQFILTNTEGVHVKGTLKDYSAGFVKLEVEGRFYTLSLSKFSETSKKDILDWAVGHMIREGELAVFTRGPIKERVKTSDGKDIQEVWFLIHLENRSELEMDDLLVEYKIYWLDGRVDHRDPFYFWIDRVQKIENLEANSESQFETSKIYLRERDDKKDSLLGIRIRISRDGVFLLEEIWPSYSYVKERMKWEPFSLEAIQ